MAGRHLAVANHATGSSSGLRRVARAAPYPRRPLDRERVRRNIPGGVREVALIIRAVARAPGVITKLRRRPIGAAGVRGPAPEGSLSADPSPVHKRVAPVRVRAPALIITSGNQNWSHHTSTDRSRSPLSNRADLRTQSPSASRSSLRPVSSWQRNR